MSSAVAVVDFVTSCPLQHCRSMMDVHCICLDISVLSGTSTAQYIYLKKYLHLVQIIIGVFKTRKYTLIHVPEYSYSCIAN